MSSLEDLGQRYERLHVAIAEQLFNQTAGLSYDADLLNQLGEEMTAVCEEFLAQFTEPRLMYLASLAALAQVARLPHRLKLAEERLKVITSPHHAVKGRPVTWASWRQFNAVTDDAEKRREVFDLFVEKAPHLIPFIKGGFDAAREAYGRFNQSPLNAFLEQEVLHYNDLTQLLNKLGSGARHTFLQAVEHYAQEIKQEPFEYYDDFYFFRGRIFQPLDVYLKGVDPLAAVERVLRGLNFAVDRIQVDNEDRPKKSPSAFCFGIHVPDDVRVVYKSVSPGSDLGSVFHEFGHGIHGISASPKDPPWKRYVIPRSVGETFSILIESLVSNPLFLTEDLGLDAAAAQEVVDRRNFMELYFVVFYSANSLMKLAYWQEGLSFAAASQRWQELTRRFYIEIPGDYWLLHHVMPRYDIYAPSYLLAAIRVTNLLHELTTEFGDRWWQAPRVGTYIAELAATRGEFPMQQFSLNPDRFLSRIQQLSFL